MQMKKFAYWKEQSLHFILVSILMLYDEQDLSYKQLEIGCKQGFQYTPRKII